MKISQDSPLRSLVFRETFNDETAVRRNGGTPTNVVFEKGKGIFNGTDSWVYNDYDAETLNFDTELTIEVKIKPGTLAGTDRKGIVQKYDATGHKRGYRLQINEEEISFYISDNGISFEAHHYVEDLSNKEVHFIATFKSGNVRLFKNGVKVYDESSAYSFINRNDALFSIGVNVTGGSTASGSFLDSDISFINLYRKSVTDSEAKNLYENKWNTELSGLNGQAKANKVIDAQFNDSSGWTLGDGWSVGNGKATCDGTQSTTSLLRQANIFEVNKTYRWGIKIDSVSAGSVSVTRAGFIFQTFTTPGTYTDIATMPNSLTNNTYYLNANADFVGEIDWVSVQEIGSNKLCDINAFNSVLKDRTDLTLTPSNVEIKKIGSYSAPSFNGVDSAIVTNSTSPTIWQNGFTLVTFVNLKGWGGNNNGRLFDKSTAVTATTGFILYLVSNKILRFRINDGDIAVSATNSVDLSQWKFIATTVSADAKVNFYIGDLQTAPTLSGNANQPVSPVSNITTTNPLTIGNRSTATDRGFDGLIPFAQAYSGVLDLAQLTQIWSNTKRLIK
jgi:hypothetical protein